MAGLEQHQAVRETMGEILILGHPQQTFQLGMVGAGVNIMEFYQTMGVVVGERHTLYQTVRLV